MNKILFFLNHPFIKSTLNKFKEIFGSKELTVVEPIVEPITEEVIIEEKVTPKKVVSKKVASKKVVKKSTKKKQPTTNI
jgi:hypothetical protein